VRKDCPHCSQSMEGRFLHWRKFAKMDHFRSCPLCGKDLEFQLYPEEVGVRVLAAAAVIYGFYWAKQHGGGWIAMLLTVAAAVAAGFFLVHLRLRDRQRFRKGSYNSSSPSRRTQEEQ
jgi:uncharacterized protein (DUF983 family)